MTHSAYSLFLSSQRAKSSEPSGRPLPQIVGSFCQAKQKDDLVGMFRDLNDATQGVAGFAYAAGKKSQRDEKVRFFVSEAPDVVSRLLSGRGDAALARACFLSDRFGAFAGDVANGKDLAMDLHMMCAKEALRRDRPVVALEQSKRAGEIASATVSSFVQGARDAGFDKPEAIIGRLHELAKNADEKQRPEIVQEAFVAVAALELCGEACRPMRAFVLKNTGPAPV